jgi:ArsR family metal-binding transcriptional regulator
VLDEIENGNFGDLDFVELNACIGGCVGGTLNVENPFIAKARLRSMRKYLPVSGNHVSEAELLASEIFYDSDIENAQVDRLSEDRMTAIAKMSEIECIYRELPHLDCGSCGAPNCHALAEDIVKDDAKKSDCLIQLREKQKNK